MGILSDRQIKDSCLFGAIMPYANQENRPGIVSYGITSYGYDCRVGPKFKVFKPFPCTVIDPKNFDTRMLEEIEVTEPAPNNFILIPPHSFVLAETVETFDIPRDTLCVVLGKSTYARCGLIVNCTPLEPEWRGTITIELSNTTPLPMKVYVNEGIAQVLFFRSDEKVMEFFTAIQDHYRKSIEIVNSPDYSIKTYNEEMSRFLGDLADCELQSCLTSYKDKKGKYQDQTGVQVPIVHGKAEIVPVKKEDKVCPPVEQTPPTRLPVKVDQPVRAFKDFNLLGKDVKKGEPLGVCTRTYVDDGKGIPQTVRLKDFPRSCEGDEVQVGFECVEGCPVPVVTDPINPQNIVKGQTAIIDDKNCPFDKFWGEVEQVIGGAALLRTCVAFSFTDSEKSTHVFPVGSIIQIPLSILHDYIPF